MQDPQRMTALPMRRVLVIGRSGGGKTTLARALAERLGVPWISLDRRYWRPGWVETPLAEWTAMQPELVAGEAWVIDGTYHRTLPLRLPRADTVIWIDLPRWLCMARLLWRMVSTCGRVRDDMGPGCPERFDREFLRYSWRYDRVAGPRIRQALATLDPSQTLVILRAPRAVRAFLRNLEP